MLPLALLLLATAPAHSGALPAPSFPDQAASPAAADLAQAQALAQSLLDSVRTKDAPLHDSLLDAEALVDRAIAGLGLAPDFLKGWRPDALFGLRTAWSSDLATLSDPSKFEFAFVRVRGTERERSLLYRLRMHPGERFEYLEFRTGRGADGKLRVVDWIPLSTGELRSAKIRFGLLTSTQEDKRPDPAHLAGIDREYYDHSGLVRRLTGPLRKSEWQETLGLFETLPLELQREPKLLLAELRIASWLDDRARVQSCYEELTGRDPELVAVDLLAFMHGLWGKDEERALLSVRRLQAILGGDSELDWVEGDLLLRRGELDAAATLAERAQKAEPGWQPPWRLKLSIALARRDPAAVLAALIELDSRFQVEWKDFAADPEYKDFVASPQHAEWLKHLASKPKK